MSDIQYDVIVVGAGMGGAGSAALLAQRGLKVLLLEKNKYAGGKAMSLSKNGLSFSPFFIVSTPSTNSLHERILNELGIADSVVLKSIENSAAMYRAANNEYIACPDMTGGALDPNVLFDWLGLNDKQKENALNCFMELTLMEEDQAETLRGISFLSWMEKFSLDHATAGFIIGCVCDGLFMLPPDQVDAPEAIYCIQDVFLRGGSLVCEGGYGKLAEALCQSTEDNGGTVLMSTRINNIVIEDGCVTGVDTEKGIFHAPIVISNAGLHPTVLKLAGEEHFADAYLDYVRTIKPSYGMVGYRYYLNRQVTEKTYGNIFSIAEPLTAERIDQACKGNTEAAKELGVWFEVPSNYTDCDPRGKQVFVAGCFAPADPSCSREELKNLANALEKIVFGAFPGLEAAIESKDLYTPKTASNMSRDGGVVDGAGGETIGLGQAVGVCGKNRPSFQSPVSGLYYVGTDVGKRGVGTQLAIHSAYEVADAVSRLKLKTWN
jgi:phytoene dehydrogenase-like protein